MTRPEGRKFVQTRQVTLQVEETWHGVTLPAGSTLEVTESNTAYYATPSRDLVLNGHTVLQGTQLYGLHDGKVRQLSARAGQHLFDLVIAEDNTLVSFSDDGRLSYLHPKGPTRVRGLTVTGPVEFHPLDGAPVSSCVLAEPAEVFGIPVAAGRLLLHPNGHVFQAVLARDLEFTVRGVAYVALGGRPVELYPDGAPSLFSVATDRQDVDARVRARGREKRFWPDGNPRSGVQGEVQR